MLVLKPETWQSKEDPEYTIEVVRRKDEIVTARVADGDESTVFCLTQSELEFNFELITVVETPRKDTS